MTNDEIALRSTAMQLKMKRFCMKSIVVTGYYIENDYACIAFIDISGYVWHVSDCHRILVGFNNTSFDAKEWLNDISKRLTTTNMQNRYRATLVEGVDYAITFNWLQTMAKKYGDLSLCKISNYSIINDRQIFEKFFIASDTPETIIVESDLHAL